MLGGCGAFENLGGGKKVSPDEFKIVSHSPLTMPPNAELRPPRPGEPRPQEVTPADQAKEALSPALAARPQRNQVMTGTAQTAGRTSAEASLVQKAGGGNTDPNIRSRVNHRHQDHQRQRQDVHRQPDLLAGHAAFRRGHRPDQGAAAHPRRPGRGPAAPRANADHQAAPARPARRHLLSPGSDPAPPRSARRPDCGRCLRLALDRARQALLGRPAQVRRLHPAQRPAGRRAAVEPRADRQPARGLQGRQRRRGLRQDRHRPFPRAHDVQGHGHAGGPTEFSRTVSSNGGRDNAYTELRHDRLLPDRRARPARDGHAHGGRPHGQPAHHREGADPRAPGRARGAPHAHRQLARPPCSARRCPSSSTAATSPTACRSRAMSTT